MTDREALATLLRPHCAGVLDRLADEALRAADHPQLPSKAELRVALDRGAEHGLRAIALRDDERRVQLRALVAASRGALDRLAVPTVARYGLSRIGLQHARATVDREVEGRADEAALRREFVAFEADLTGVLQDATLVV